MSITSNALRSSSRSLISKPSESLYLYPHSLPQLLIPYIRFNESISNSWWVAGGIDCYATLGLKVTADLPDTYCWKGEMNSLTQQTVHATPSHATVDTCCGQQLLGNIEWYGELYDNLGVTELTGNHHLDKAINKFYNCLSHTHEDPPTIEKIDNCYYQTLQVEIILNECQGDDTDHSIPAISGGVIGIIEYSLWH